MPSANVRPCGTVVPARFPCTKRRDDNNEGRVVVKSTPGTLDATGDSELFVKGRGRHQEMRFRGSFVHPEENSLTWMEITHYGTSRCVGITHEGCP